MIRLNNVSKKLKRKEILKNINLDFKRGEVVMIHGHNGSGKTMILRLLCNLIKATDGEIILEEKPSFGVIIENPNFFRNESAFYNLSYLASINRKISSQEIEQWLKKFNLYEVKDQKVKTFSLGMRQRLALCQAFMENPNVILLDEPFNGIDEDNLDVIYKTLIEEKEKGKIIVIASHIMLPIDNLVDKKIKMSNGEVKEILELNTLVKSKTQIQLAD